MKDVPKDFRSKLKKMRKSFRGESHSVRGLTVRELGHRAGIHFARISAFESGRRTPGLESLRKLADAFELIGGDADEFIASGREDARMSKTQKDFPLIPNAIQKRLLEEISKALQNRNVGEICEIYDHPECDLMWITDSDEWFAVEIVTVAGRSDREALSKLSRKLESKGKQIRKL